MLTLLQAQAYLEHAAGPRVWSVSMGPAVDPYAHAHLRFEVLAKSRPPRRMMSYQ